ncbi:glycosyltransferase [Mangrovicoccus algicola]|uniref:Glycosyltransferase n=1 Tax=Mangrovicoccus algicola TaxID=2771008 RepID=A0A8J6YZZ6_9RHOB|nr:glycosyltransferase [Mangrovicoccus algicola]MBE3639008.1 glycosyltransferase [Mangrovicoccus algicola]
MAGSVTSTRFRHVLVVNVHFDPDNYGGATIVAREVARHLRGAGMRVSAVATMQAEELPPYAVVRSHRDGIDTFRINMPPGPAPTARFWDDQMTARVTQIAAQVGADVAHLHCLQGLGAGLIPGLKAQGIPVILSIHDFWWLCQRQFMVQPDGRYCGQDPVRLRQCAGCVPNRPQLEERSSKLFAAVRQADLVTFPSAYAHGLSMRSGLPARRNVILENGINHPGPGFFDNQAARRATSPELTFGFVGGPSAVKGWPLVRAAFQRIDRADFRGIVVDGSLDGSWWRPSMFQGMRGEWQIHPRFEQSAGLDGFYASIDVLLFLSQWRETFGLVVREAISRGVRVIQTEGGGATEHRAVSRRLPIGASPEELSEALGQELRNRDAHPAPVPCRSFAEQAEELLLLMETL